MSTHAELSSATTALDELLARLRGLEESLTALERDRLANELWEVERNLTAASRRLAKLVEASARL